MNNNNVTLSVVINGAHHAREFISPMDRQTYIEGREGSNFALRITNNNAFKVLAILSVDGLSVLDGKPAGEKSSGYIIDARQTLDVPGWVVDNGTAAKFFFSGMKANGGDDSYAAQSGADTANKGVIGLKVIKEEIQYNNAYFGSSRGFQTSGSNAKSLSLRSVPQGLASRGTASLNNLTVGALLNDAIVASSSTMSLDNAATAAATVTQTLGAGFGEATDFATTKTEFLRGDLLAMMVMYYNDARSLKKLGIDVTKEASKKPSAFPADDTGCQPPVGWTR